MTDASPAAVISLKDVHKIYRTGDIEVHALRGVSLEVRRGEFVAVMGPSGSGKSTMMNLIGCLDRPTSGTYILDGIDVSTMSKNQRADTRNTKIGFVFQSFNLLPRTSALDNVELPLIYSNDSHRAKDREVRARRCLAAVGLQGREDHQPSQLSGGQQQRVACARALVCRPDVIFADEPTGNLDSRTSGEILTLLRSMVSDLGQTTVMVTHDAHAAAIADRVLFLADGNIVRDLGRSSAHEILEALEAVTRR